MSGRSKVPEGYDVAGRDDYDGEAYWPEVLIGDSEYDTEPEAIAACWAHRDAIIREELERLRDEMCFGCSRKYPMVSPGYHQQPPGNEYECGATIVNERLAQLEDPDAK